MKPITSLIIFLSHYLPIIEASEGLRLFLIHQHSLQPPLPIDLSPSATIGDIKHEIRQTNASHPEQEIILNFAGEQITDADDTPLSDSGVGAQATIHYHYHLDPDEFVLLNLKFTHLLTEQRYLGSCIMPLYKDTYPHQTELKDEADFFDEIRGKTKKFMTRLNSTYNNSKVIVSIVKDIQAPQDGDIWRFSYVDTSYPFAVHRNVMTRDVDDDEEMGMLVVGGDKALTFESLQSWPDCMDPGVIHQIDAMKVNHDIWSARTGNSSISELQFYPEPSDDIEHGDYILAQFAMPSEMDISIVTTSQTIGALLPPSRKKKIAG